MTTRLLLADSAELIIQGLQCILSTEENIEVCGVAYTTEELLRASSLQPDVVLVDYSADGFSINAIPKLLKACPDTRVIAITSDQTATTIRHAIRSGVSSYVRKDCSAKEIQDAIVETHRGEKFFCGKVLEVIRDAAINVDEISFESLSCDPVSLTNRELEVITYIAEGLTNNEIADRLYLSNHTITTHRKNIMNKLGINNTAGIVMYAVKSRLISPNRFLFAPEIEA